MFFRSKVLFVCAVVFLCSCSYYTSVGVTKNLAPGMSAQQVRAVMQGDPQQTSFMGNRWVWKYWLADFGKGNVPHYLIFDRETQTLQGWAANEAEFYAQQQMWAQTINSINQTFPPKQKHEIIIKHR